MSNSDLDPFFLACFKQLWQISSDPMLVLRISNKGTFLEHINAKAQTLLEVDAGAELSACLPDAFSNKLTVLCLQASHSQVEVRYQDRLDNELVLTPFRLNGAELVLCRLSNLESMLTQSKSVCEAEQASLSSVVGTKKLSGTVLIADDHPDNRSLICRLLQRMGLAVKKAKDGEQAVEMALANDYELIIMDIQMPVLDGEQALDLLQQSGLSCPVIALSSNRASEDISAYLALGFTAHLAKPIDKEAFVEMVKHYVSQASQLDNQALNLSSDEYLSLKRKYISHLPNDIGRLKAAFEGQDWRLLSKVAHAIKGSSGNFGFVRLSELSGELEQVVDKEQPLALINQAMQALLNEYASYRL